MLMKRVIPCLLFSSDGLYKTSKYKNKKYVGDPINTIRLFNDLEVDEIILLDIDASKKNTGPNYDLISDIASECFMPLCYGGGIFSIKEAEKIFSLGVEKICINSSALKDLTLITELSRVFGSQSIVVAIDTKCNFLGKTKLYSHIKAKMLNIPIIQYVKDVASAGAGELFITSVHLEGSMSGFDLEQIAIISKEVNIPIIAHGGGGDLSHIISAFESGASAVCCGSKFIYQGPHKAVLINYLSVDEYLQINPIY
jgi:imidazole glycerol-phosphate synthase subunit HisF